MIGLLSRSSTLSIVQSHNLGRDTQQRRRGSRGSVLARNVAARRIGVSRSRIEAGIASPNIADNEQPVLHPDLVPSNEVRGSLFAETRSRLAPLYSTRFPRLRQNPIDLGTRRRHIAHYASLRPCILKRGSTMFVVRRNEVTFRLFASDAIHCTRTPFPLAYDETPLISKQDKPKLGQEKA